MSSLSTLLFQYTYSLHLNYRPQVLSFHPTTDKIVNDNLLHPFNTTVNSYTACPAEEKEVKA
jgi:hypothetical protein